MDALSEQFRRIVSNPVVVAAVLGAALEAMRGATTWADAWPLVFAAVVRQLVTPVHDLR